MRVKNAPLFTSLNLSQYLHIV